MTNLDLKSHGLKTTVPRQIILGMLENSEGSHLSAEDIYHQLISGEHHIALGTVYRVLTQFEQAGIIIRHNFEGRPSVFEMNNNEHHDHMVCLECGKVLEFCDQKIEELQKKVALSNDFQLHDHSLTLYGLCAECQ